MAVETPMVVGPADGEKTVIPIPSFYWDTAATPYTPMKSFDVRYEIQIASDASFETVIDKDTVDIPRYVPDKPLAGTVYWRVRASKDGSTSSWSAVRTLTIIEPVHVYSVPDGADNAAIAAVISNAIADGASARIDFAANGRYIINAGPNAITVQKARDLILNGNKATFIIKSNTIGFLRMNRSTNVMVRGFFIDYDPLPYTVAKVIAMTATTMTVIPEPGHPDFDSPQMQYSWTWGVALDPLVRGRLKANVPFILNTKKDDMKRDGNRFTLTTSFVPSAYFSLGDRYLQFARDRAQGLTFTTESSNVVMYDNINYATPAGHYLNIDGSDYKVIHCASPVKEGRFWGGNADGVHTRANGIGPWVEGCEFNGVGDDGIAIYNKAMFILEKTSPTSIRISNDLFYLAPGDRFCIFNPRDGVIPADGLTAESVAFKQKEAGFGAHWLVTFSPALDIGLMTAQGPLENDQAFNRSKVNALFMIRSNYIHNIRRYGSVIRGVNGVIENNRYEGCSSAGIIVRNEPAHWRNGSYSDSLLIKNNLIADCAIDTLRQGSIVVNFERLSGESGAPAQRNIIIESNRIVNWQTGAVIIGAASNVTVRGNTIAGEAAQFLAASDNAVPVTVSRSSRVTVENNDISDKRPLLGVISIERSTGVTTNGNNVRARIDMPAANEFILGITDDECAFTGDWKSSGLKGFKGKKTVYTTEAGASARWKVPAGVKGKTKVLFYKVWHSAENDTAVAISVKHETGSDTVSVDTTKGQSEWAEIGSYSFTGGADEGVTVTKKSAGNTRVSAVKFVVEQ